jgi:Cu/Ag efflux protein CusF
MSMRNTLAISFGVTIAAQFLFVSCTNNQASAQAAPATPRGASAVHVDSVTCTAVVTAIDHDKRTTTLRLPSGAEKTFEAGKELVNFDQVKTGDHLKITFAESLAVHTRSPQSPSEAVTGEATVALAPKGAMPGGAVAGTVEITAKVVDIDRKARLATLAADGRTRTIHVGPNIDLSKVKAGDEVVFRYTRGVLLRVERPTGSDAELAAARQPGAIAVETTIADAIITSLDKDQRTLTLKRPDGSEQLYKAAASVHNFDQLKSGDAVRVALAEAMAVTVRKAGTAPEAEPSSVALLAGDSSTDAVTVHTVQETDKIEAVDLESRLVTLKRPNGDTRIIPVGPQVNLSALAPGDDVVLRMTSGIVVNVEK